MLDLIVDSIIFIFSRLIAAMVWVAFNGPIDILKKNKNMLIAVSGYSTVGVILGFLSSYFLPNFIVMDKYIFLIYLVFFPMLISLLYFIWLKKMSISKQYIGYVYILIFSLIFTRWIFV